MKLFCGAAAAWLLVPGCFAAQDLSAPGWFQKGLTESDGGKWSQAAACFRNAIALSPGYVAAHLELGDVSLRLGDFDQAEEELDTVLRLDARNAGAHYGLGMIRLQEGNFAGAETEFRRTLELKSDFGPAEEYLGVTLVQQHKWPEARRVLEHALAVNPDSLAATNAYATALASLGDQAGAADEFQKARELSRRQIALNRAQGEVTRGLELWHFGKPQEAAAAFRASIQAKPDYPDAHNNLGSLLLFLGDTDGAVEQFSITIKLRPAFALAHYNLARALIKKEDLPQAESELRKTILLDPRMARAHIDLGVLLAAKGNNLSSDARAELNEGLRLDPQLKSSIPPEYLRNLR
ncbi:MAG: tetratricopeptide repeat protein [Bryobacteraceae bacterium]